MDQQQEEQGLFESLCMDLATKMRESLFYMNLATKMKESCLEEMSRTSGSKMCANCQNITFDWIRCQGCIKQDGISNFYCNDQCIREYHDLVNTRRRKFYFDH